MQGALAHTCSAPPPAGPTVWEASRFCPSPSVGHRRERLRLLWEILCGITETALLYGVDQIIFTANSKLLPLTLKCGWETRLLGPTLIDGCDEVTGVSARMSPEGLRRLRCRTGISAPVTRFITAPWRRAA
jgi:acyl-homoserine lactone synthase